MSDNYYCPTQDGDPCHNDDCAQCREREAYWRRQWEAYGRDEVANRPAADDIRDAYSHPTEAAKRESLLRDLSDQ